MPRLDDDSLDDDDFLRNDILRGAKKIGRYIGRKTRDAYYGLESGHIPGRKEGGVWTSTKSLLREHYNTPTNLKLLDTSTEPTNSTEAEAAPPPVIERRRLSPPRVPPSTRSRSSAAQTEASTEPTEPNTGTEAEAAPPPRPPRAAPRGRQPAGRTARSARR